MTLVLDVFMVGGDRGQVAAWSWNRSTSVQFAPFTSTTGPVHAETFDSEWHSPNADPRVNNDPFVGELVVPTTAVPALFGAGLREAPKAVETFERHWRLPQTPPASRTVLGNEETLLSWSEGVNALFVGGETVEAFEHDWSTNEAFVWSFTSPMLTAALFESAPVDDFESWSTFYFAFLPGASSSPGHVSPAMFAEGASSFAFESFEQVAPDLPITFTPPNTITASSATGFFGSQGVSFYNGGGVGALPPEIDSRRTYYCLTTFSPTDFNISTSIGGPALNFSAASGNNFVKSDPGLFWTLTDVGI